MIYWSKRPAQPKLDVLAFGAHPDDIELMCAGTLVLLSRSHQVGAIDVTEAELSTNGNEELRLLECQRATEIMGIHARGNLKRLDGELYRDLELTEMLTMVLRSCQPKIVFGPPHGCRHPDHQALHEALKRAIFYSGVKKYLPSHTAIVRPKFYQYLEVEDQKPDLCINISEVWETKKQAMLAYESQFSIKEGTAATFINSGFIESLERRFRTYGQSSGVMYAEPFLCSSAPLLKAQYLLD